jgi:solute carrier family 34 (sodium-dependent phosphate cotransporter)
MSDPTGHDKPSADVGRSMPRPGTRQRWTELIQRHRGKREVILNLLKVAVLIYAFLLAIKMMGHGIKVTATNPEYKTAKALIEGYGDPVLKKKAGEVVPVTPAQLGAGDRSALKQRGTVAAFGSITVDQGGAVAFKDRCVSAQLVEGLPTEMTTAAPKGPVRIVEIRDEAVVVEPIKEHKDWLYTVFGYASNPFLALLVGILITAIFQSSSFTTSFTVGLVAAVNFPLHYAIPIVMGANIGTSVTNIAVSMGYIRRKVEFQRAFAGATVHDFFNVLTVIVLFTIEQTTRVFSTLAQRMAGVVYTGDATAVKPPNIISIIVGPVIKTFEGLLSTVLGIPPAVAGTVMTVVAVLLLFAALLLLVKVLKKLVMGRAESFFDRVLFRNAGIAFVFGLILTAAVQSSSVTTSLVVPLIAAGVLTLEQVFPYFLGANIGTTVTALLAAFAVEAHTEQQAKVGLTLACAHLLFNVVGAIIFYPLRWLPISMARGLAKRAAQSKWYAIGFVAIVFFVIPLLGISVQWLIQKLAGGE